MDQETLFTTSKWEILKSLSKGQKSPLELARETKTSIANISQQLRMLELANIVKSERVGNRERGEPRILYSLIGPLSYLISVSPDFVDKKQMMLTPYHETTMKIWFMKDESSHYYLQKLFWEIEPKLDKIESIIVKSEYSKIKVTIVSEDSELKKEIKSKDVKKSKNESKRIEISIFSKSGFHAALKEGKEFSLQDELSSIYDPLKLFEKIKKEMERKI
jgi:predicted transcriptional regulator